MFLQTVFVLSVLLTVLSAILVVATRHIMYSAVYLLGTLIGIAGLYLTLNADVLAATQLLVYVGGVVILMVFAIMLTGGQDFMKSISGSMSHTPFMGNVRTYIVGALAALIIGSVIYKLMINVLGKITVEANTTFASSIEILGKKLVTDHVLVFEIASILLLGAMVGAATIARPMGKKE